MLLCLQQTAVMLIHVSHCGLARRFTAAVDVI